MFESWGMIKEETRDYDTTIYFTFRDGVQNQLYALNYNDPVAMYLILEFQNYGKLELTKLNENGDLINGSIFRIEGENYSKDVTVENGKIIVENLNPGIYTIKELSAPSGYLIDTKTYNVEIKANETTKQSIENKEPTGKILLSIARIARVASRPSITGILTSIRIAS